MSFKVERATLKEIAQSLQEGRKMARSLENLAGSLIPLAEEGYASHLKMIEESATGIAELLKRLYNEVAPHAFGAPNEAGN